jgi:hypothetical protein
LPLASVTVDVPHVATLLALALVVSLPPDTDATSACPLFPVCCIPGVLDVNPLCAAQNMVIMRISVVKIPFFMAGSCMGYGLVNNCKIQMSLSFFEEDDK